VEVIGCVPGGPADRGGVQAGDVLLGVGDVSVLDLEALNQTLRALKPGQRAVFRLLRKGKMQSVPLQLGDRTKVSGFQYTAPAPAPPVPAAPTPMVRVFRDPLGADVTDIPAELRKHYGAPAELGALVVQLDPGGPGAQAGLRVGDIVVRAGQREVVGAGDILAGILSAPTGEVELEVIRARKPVTISVPRPAVPRPAVSAARVAELTDEVARLRARVAELEAELEKERARRE
jgi:serine protease Do